MVPGNSTLGMFAWWALVILGRRVIGLLVLELETDGISPNLSERLRTDTPKGRILKVLDWVSRMNAGRSVFWLLVLSVPCLVAIRVFLGDGIQTFLSYPATPGTFFYWFRSGVEQPTIAGLASMVIVGVLHNYPIILAARLMVAFAVVCECVAIGHTRIVPHHPDGTGGLLAVGRTSLFMSLFPVLAGLGLSVNLIQARMRLTLASREVGVGSDMIPIILSSIGLYLLVAPILFFLPLLPLRQVMARAKRAYLVGAEEVLARASERHLSALTNQKLDAETTQELEYIYKLYEYAQAMAVWPFDRRTFVRFVGLTAGPLVPLLGPWVERIAEPLRRLFLGE